MSKELDELNKRVESLQPIQQAAIKICSAFIKVYIAEVNKAVPGAGNIGLVMASMEYEHELDSAKNTCMISTVIH